MALKDFDQLVDEINQAVHTDGREGKTTGIGLNSVLQSIAKELTDLPQQVAAPPDSTGNTAYSVLPYAPTITLDLAGAAWHTLTVAGNLTFTETTNKAAARSKVIRLVSDGSARTLIFPPAWVFVGATAPTSLAAGRTAILTLTCFGSTEDDIVAGYAAQA
ncbi:hypothetical protein [Hymenobacter rubripertinctus]|uniref:Uncharacterized protein n=1 Tax=Hymenobacter rubripertinctus TaxID=2029981 RepID=A0A418QL52_9BACT|nr:hypothetical protein [Hymenobacter rubripertinctus]RIY05809.1 hypothetical protein D0T11_19760 [Hymenobacter rubripertinctus]